MLDITFVRENKQKVKDGVAAKQLDPKVVDDVLRLYDKWTDRVEICEKLRQERNRIAHESNGYSEKGKDIKEKLVKAELDVHEAYKEYDNVARQIPNPPAEDVKIGKNETGNEVLRKWGKISNFDFEPKEYSAIGKDLDIIDTERASKVSGARFGYLKKDAALLEFALVQF